MTRWQRRSKALLREHLDELRSGQRSYAVQLSRTLGMLSSVRRRSNDSEAIIQTARKISQIKSRTQGGKPWSKGPNVLLSGA